MDDPIIDRSEVQLVGDRWAGTPSDVARIAEAVLQAFELAGVSRAPRFGIDVQWYDQDAGREVTRTFPTAHTFRERVGEVDLERVREIDIYAYVDRGPAPRDDQHVIVHLGAGFLGDTGINIWAKAQADQEQFAAAAAHQVAAIVDEGEKNTPNLERWARRLTFLLVVITSAVLVFTDSTAWAIVALIAATAGASLDFIPARLWWVLFPPFELFPEGGLPRSDRVRKRLAAVARVLERPLYVAVFAVLFVVVVTRLFD